MELKVKEVVVYIRKYFLCSLKSTYKFTCKHPFVASFAFSLLFLYSCYPSLFAFLVSSFPVLFCTALLLGILLSYGEPNIPEIEEDDNTKDSAPYGEKEREIDFFAVSSSVEEHNKVAENLEVLMKEQSASYMRLSEVADTASEGIEGLMAKIKKPELDDWLDSSLGRPWQPINMRDVSSDSESDRAESSSPDASMADILPMLDELSPLLESEAPHNDPKSAENSDLELSQHPESDEDSVEKEDECKPEEKDESNKVVAWTADDLKNVMDLGSSDLERNRRLESLIARRRARKNQIIIYEKDLIDLHSDDATMDELFHFHPQIPPIFAPRVNPFDLPNDLDESKGLPPIPGSAPSVMLRQQNPFDFPYESEEGNKGLVGERLRQPEFGLPSQRGHLFRRHESFASHSAFPSNLMHEKLGSSRLNPCFAAEKMESERNDYGEGDTKSSSVPTSNTISSAIDLEDQEVPTEQYGQFYEYDLVDSRPELAEDGHSADPNASAATEENGFVKKPIEQIQFGQNYEDVEEKHDDLTLFSSSKGIEKNFDISEASSESMHSSDASAMHPICETKAFDDNEAAVPIYDSSPSGSGKFLANISVPDDNILSSGGEGLHSVSAKSHVQEDAVEVVSHAKELEKSLTLETIEFNVVNGNKLQDSTSSGVETVTFPTYMNLLDENRSAAMEVFETGEVRGFNESSSPKIDEGFGDIATTLEGEEKHQSKEEFEMQTSFGIYLEESRVSNLELGPIPEENTEDFKVQEEDLSSVQTAATFASSGMLMLETPDVSLSSVGQEVIFLHNQSKEEARDDGSEDLVFLSEKAEPSNSSNPVNANDVIFNGSVIGELVDSKEFSNQSSMKPNDDISDSQDDIIDEFQINQDVNLMNLNDFHSEHGDGDADIGETQVIDEHLLLELDAVGDFQVEGLSSQECPRMESQSDRRFVCSGEDSEMSPNTEEPTDSGYWSLTMSPVEDLTVYNPKLSVLEACSPLQLDSIFKQEHLGELVEPPLSNPITGKLVTKNDEDISSALVEDGRDFDVSVSPHFDFQHSDYHSAMDGGKSELTVVDACRYDSTEIRSAEIKADHIESVGPFASHPSAIAEAETSSGELDISSRDFEIVEADSELLVLEAKSIEDIHDKSISPLINTEPMITHPVDPVVEVISPEVEKTSGLLVLEVKSAEDIKSAFKQAAEEALATSAVHFSDLEKTTNHPDFEVTETSSPAAKNSPELFVLEARSAEDIQFAFKKVTEEVSAVSTSLTDSERSKTNHNKELLVHEGNSSEDIDSAFELADSDLDKQTSDVHPWLLVNRIDSEVVDVKSLETGIDRETLIPDAKYVEKNDSSFNHDAAKNESLRASADSEQLVLEAESVEEADSLNQVTEELFDWSSPLVVPNAAGAYEVADMISLGLENDSDMLSFETKSSQHLNSASKQDTETDLVQPNLQELGDFQPNHDTIKEKPLNTIDKSEPFVLESKPSEDTNSVSNEAGVDFIVQSTTALVDPGHSPEQEATLDVKSPSGFHVPEAKSLENSNLAFRQAIEVCLSNAESELDTERDSVGELIDLDEKSAENTQSTFSDAHAGVHEGSSSRPVDLELMEIHLCRQVEDDMCFEAENNSDMLAVEAKSLEDIHSAFKQATDVVATSPLPVESRSLDLQTVSTFTEVTEGCLDGSVTAVDDSKQTGTIPEPKPVTDGNLDAEQGDEVDYAKETTVASNEAVTVEDQINRRTVEEEGSSENPSSNSPPSMKKSVSSSSSSSSSSDSE